MKNDRHDRAQRLIDTERVEGLTREDQTWLEAHLRKCADCSRWANRTDAALRSLLSVPVTVPLGLAAAPSLRIRYETEALHQRRTRSIGLIVSCALSWVLGVASAPLVWRVCAWLGREFGLPRVLWVLGFALWWFVPASAAAALILWQRDRIVRESPGSLLERHHWFEN